jgi:hypothetical protein
MEGKWPGGVWMLVVALLQHKYEMLNMSLRVSCLVKHTWLRTLAGIAAESGPLPGKYRWNKGRDTSTAIDGSLPAVCRAPSWSRPLLPDLHDG